MPPCSPAINAHRSSLKPSQTLLRAVSTSIHVGRPRCSSRHAKRYSNAPSTSNKTQEGSTPFSVKTDGLTLLYKTTKLLPRVLDTVEATSDIPRIGGTPQTWEVLLSGAHEDLSATNERPVKVVVRGLDQWSGTTELVSALLADPLASTEANEVLETRWKGTNVSQINIMSSSFPASSAYLTQFSIPIEITEFRQSTSTGGSPRQILEDPAIWEADIPILVCNPLMTPLASVLQAHLPANTILVLSTSMEAADLHSIIQTSAHSSTPNKLPEIISVDPKRALNAIRAFQADPNSFSAIQKYQTGFVGSRLASITNALRSRLTPREHIPTVRTNLALNHISDALRFYLYIIEQVRYEDDKAFIDASCLKEKIAEIQSRTSIDVFGRQIPGKEMVDEVNEAVKQAQKEMKYVLDRLTWWRTVWRVDEVSGIVSSALQHAWCQGLERKLILQTGRLSVLQADLTEAAFKLLASHPSVSKAVLRNTLLQLKGSPNYQLTPEALTHPIATRRKQIIEYPTTRLHVKAQQTIIGMSGGVASGVGVAWAGWLGWLTGTGEGLLGFVGLDAGTALGVGMLGTLAAIRWAMGSWEKSKKRWWQDWERATDGLDRDLKDNLDKVIQQQVVIVAETASAEVMNVVRLREEQLMNVKSQVMPLQSSVDRIALGTRLKP